MTEVRFKHYQGAQYKQQDFKIFVLGESHYFCKKDLDAFAKKEKYIENVTQDVVNRFLEYKRNQYAFSRWMTTFTKFSNIVSDAKLSSTEIIDFWEKSVFYNFVQSPTTKPRTSPTQQEFKDSIEPFLNTTNLTDPNIIFIWGYRLWNNLPKENLFTERLIEGEIINIYNNIPIIVTPHPSSSKFNYSLRKQIKSYIQLVKSNTT